MDFSDWMRKNHHPNADDTQSIRDLMREAFDAGREDGLEAAAEHVRGLRIEVDPEGDVDEADDVAADIEKL